MALVLHIIGWLSARAALRLGQYSTIIRKTTTQTHTSSGAVDPKPTTSAFMMFCVMLEAKAELKLAERR